MDAMELRSASQWQARFFVNRLLMARVYGGMKQLCVLNSISMVSLNMYCNHIKPYQLTRYISARMLRSASQGRTRSFLDLLFMIEGCWHLIRLCSVYSISMVSMNVHCNHSKPHQRTSYTDTRAVQSASQWQVEVVLKSVVDDNCIS